MVTKSLDDLAETHSSVSALLESRVISPATRRNLEQFLQKLEQEMTKLPERSDPDTHRLTKQQAID